MAMSKTAKILLIIGASALAVVLVAIIGIALMAESLGKPDIPDNSVLVLKVSGSLPDYTPENKWAKIFKFQQPQSFSGLLTQLRKAKVDKRINAVLLDIEFPQIGWGKADELRDAIKDFRASGKPIYSFMELGMNKEYYIAAATDKIFMPPAGDLYVNGFAANAMFYRGSLDKLGIDIKWDHGTDAKSKANIPRSKCRTRNAKSSTQFWMNTTDVLQAELPKTAKNQSKMSKQLLTTRRITRAKPSKLV